MHTAQCHTKKVCLDVHSSCNRSCSVFSSLVHCTCGCLHPNLFAGYTNAKFCDVLCARRTSKNAQLRLGAHFHTPISPLHIGLRSKHMPTGYARLCSVSDAVLFRSQTMEPLHKMHPFSQSENGVCGTGVAHLKHCNMSLRADRKVRLSGSSGSPLHTSSGRATLYRPPTFKDPFGSKGATNRSAKAKTISTDMATGNLVATGAIRSIATFMPVTQAHNDVGFEASARKAPVWGRKQAAHGGGKRPTGPTSVQEPS